jgi:hypothetical protein
LGRKKDPSISPRSPWRVGLWNADGAGVHAPLPRGEGRGATIIRRWGSADIDVCGLVDWRRARGAGIQWASQTGRRVCVLMRVWGHSHTPGIIARSHWTAHLHAFQSIPFHHTNRPLRIHHQTECLCTCTWLCASTYSKRLK